MAEGSLEAPPNSQVVPSTTAFPVRSVQTVLLLGTLLALLALAFVPGLSGGWIFDDYPNIVENRHIHAESVTLGAIASSRHAYGGLIGRPLATASFAIDHALAGLNPGWFKTVNLLLHAVLALILFALTHRLIRLCDLSGEAALTTAFVVAAFWTVHPLQVSTVLYAVQRMEQLVALFSALSVLLYIHARTRQIEGRHWLTWISLSALCIPVGLLAKESAVLIPLAIMLVEVTLLRFRALNPSTAAWLKRGATAVATLYVVGALWLWFSTVSDSSAYALRDFTLAERLLTQGRVLAMYVQMILLPDIRSMVFYYDHVQPSTGLFQPLKTFWSFLGLSVLAFAAVTLARRIPLFTLGVGWFLTFHLLTSSFVPLELAFEHRNYLALYGLALAGVAVLLKLGITINAPAPRLVTGLVLTALCGLTLIRSAGWGDPMTLAMELAQNNPGSARASTDLGEQYLQWADSNPESPFFQMARDEFIRGAGLPNASPMPEQGLILLHASVGRRAEPEWWASIEDKLWNRAIGPQEFGMITGLIEMSRRGIPLESGPLVELSLIATTRLLLPPHQNYAFAAYALEYENDVGSARYFLNRAISDAGENRMLLDQIADALEGLGHPELASEARAGHVSLAPDSRNTPSPPGLASP